MDIISVAGLLSNGKDGWEDELRKKTRPRFLRTIAPTPIGSAREHPLRAVDRAVEMIREATREIEQTFEKPDIAIVGLSYGAYITLLAYIAATRMGLKNISKVILVEGPLHPDVSVVPPVLYPPLHACGIHYRERPRMAREAADALKELGTASITIVQGGREDAVVPTEAQIIPGDFETVEFENLDVTSSCGIRNGGPGIIVKLPPHLGGRSDGVKKIFPESIRNHLFWSREKMEAVRRIVENC